MYFNGPTISTPTIPALPVLFASLDLDLKDSVFVTLLSPGSLHSCGCIILNYTLASQYLDP